jgi:hypothetical protein
VLVGIPRLYHQREALRFAACAGVGHGDVCGLDHRRPIGCRPPVREHDDFAPAGHHDVGQVVYCGLPISHRVCDENLAACHRKRCRHTEGSVATTRLVRSRSIPVNLRSPLIAFRRPIVDGEDAAVAPSSIHLAINANDPGFPHPEVPLDIRVVLLMVWRRHEDADIPTQHILLGIAKQFLRAPVNASMCPSASITIDPVGLRIWPPQRRTVT